MSERTSKTTSRSEEVWLRSGDHKVCIEWDEGKLSNVYISVPYDSVSLDASEVYPVYDLLTEALEVVKEKQHGRN